MPTNHSDEPIRLFKSDFLEFFTHIRPAVVPIIWLPVAAYFISRPIAEKALDAGSIVLALILGAILWTLTEYTMHRFLFHFEPKNPNPLAERAIFLLHGVHHMQPQCKTRLVMPLIVSVPLAFVFYALFSLIVGRWLAAPQWVAPLFAGFAIGYVFYDMIHYATHRRAMRWKPLKALKRYHLLHHYRSPDGRFGVSSPLWDIVFGTLPGVATSASSNPPPDE